MMQHTKGPWEADGISVRSEGEDGRQIALCEITVRGRPYNETYDEAIANAHLIAAAPDLLEALVDCVRHLRENFRDDDSVWSQRARKAIAKATA